ncbi:phenylacetyl CoA [Paramagnetospirillum kuznetsovii]|uniref:Phenylacetyl CoA n=1 Tax=Paramagnetospirillum kuznetsovii TaxID=2053833 RepID=A0A364NV75_9PROT|nr:dimethyl sulfoxide reductase anchor subunit [Paramagnetospirillum kuznetsovii]RAU20966.1 phenylacetyl CoA [Paramagnetospirillum kuznetsovii]
MSEQEEAQPQMRHLGLAPWLQTAWDLRAAGNFIGGGSGTGLLILTSAAAYYGIYSRVLLLAGLALVGLGLFSVFLEIGRPLRAMNVLFGGKRSWMTREAMVAGVLFPLGAAALVYPDLVKVVWIPAAAYLYCQARILEATKGIPTWRSPLILPLILSTGIAEGAGAFLLLGPLVLEAGIPEWGGAVLISALAARVFVWMFYRRRMVDGGAPVAAAAVLIAFSGPFTIGGNVMPIVFLVLAGLQPDMAVAALAAAGLIAMLGGWALKITIVTKAAHNQGFAIDHSPARGSGESGVGFKPGWREVPKDKT